MAGTAAQILGKATQSRAAETSRQRLEYANDHVQRQCSPEEAAAVQNLIDLATSAIETAIAREEWDRLLQDHSARHRQVLQMLHDGYTHHEVARALGLNERTIREVVSRTLEH